MAAVDIALSPLRKESLRSSGNCMRSQKNNNDAFGSDELIVIYLSVAGSVIPLRVLESDSVALVKLRIQTCKGYVVKRQKLVFRGRELVRNDSPVKDYGVADGNVLHLVLKLSDLLVIAVRTSYGKEFEFRVDRHQSVGYLKHRIAEKWRGFCDLEDQELFCNGMKLEEQRLINDICNDSDAVIHLVVQKAARIRATPVDRGIELCVEAPDWDEDTDREVLGGKSCSPKLNVLSREPPDRNFLLEPIIVNPKAELPSSIREMINSAFDGLANGKCPVQSSEGTGGTYFMLDASGNKYVSVFKPIDEEPLAVNSPRKLPSSENGEGLKRGTRVGEGALREVAAYILDHPKGGCKSFSSGGIGFAGIPPTVMVQCLHPGFNHPQGYDCSANNMKTGSMQMFMKNDGSCEDIGPQYFPVEEVHKISVFDIRTANADRHAGNILVTKQGNEGRVMLIPIDHGYCLPENFEDCTFDWFYWPQAREPYSPETVDYIKALDAEQDIALLKFHGWELSPECTQTFRISTMLLKKGAERGLTPFAIGNIMCRPVLKKESVIEEIVREAQDLLLPGMSEAAFLETVSKIMDIKLNKLV